MHVMIDLETFGTGPDAVIAQVAAVPFELRSGGRVATGDAFNWYVRPDTCHGLKYDWDTVDWWMTRAPESRRRLLDGIRERGKPLVDALVAFQFWPGKHGFSWASIEGVWAKPLSFDVPILDYACRSFGRRLSWDFLKGRDVRTVYSLLGDPPPMDSGGTAHDALDDCVTQICQLQAVMGRLQS